VATVSSHKPADGTQQEVPVFNYCAETNGLKGYFAMQVGFECLMKLCNIDFVGISFKLCFIDILRNVLFNNDGLLQAYVKKYLTLIFFLLIKISSGKATYNYAIDGSGYTGVETCDLSNGLVRILLFY
jgi:hypothetical protein